MRYHYFARDPLEAGGVEDILLCTERLLVQSLQLIAAFQWLASLSLSRIEWSR